MALLKNNQPINAARDTIACRCDTVAVAPVNGSATRPFVEHPALPLRDADRDTFLALMDDESEPNEALRGGADWFKSLDL